MIRVWKVWVLVASYDYDVQSRRSFVLGFQAWTFQNTQDSQTQMTSTVRLKMGERFDRLNRLVVKNPCLAPYQAGLVGDEAHWFILCACEP